MKNMIITLVVALTCGLSNAANAQKLLENGLYAGAFWVGEDDFPVSYFLETDQQIAFLNGVIENTELLENLKIAFSFYDGIVITAHPESVIDSRINSNIVKFASPKFLDGISELIDESEMLEAGCISLPFGAVGNGGRGLIYSIFVFAEDSSKITENDFESCITSTFKTLSEIN